MSISLVIMNANDGGKTRAALRFHLLFNHIIFVNYWKLKTILELT